MTNLGTPTDPLLFRGEQDVLEVRTTDPAGPDPDERWIRSDIAPKTNQIATMRCGDGTDIPIFSTGTATDTVRECRRVRVNGQTGYMPVAPLADAAFTERRIQHNGSTMAYHNAVSPGAAIPDGEDWEHNDLTGRYSGDTTAPDIQTGTVFEGSYALNADGDGDLIIRDGDQFGRGFEISWQVYGQGNNDNSDSGIALVASGSGGSDWSGYSLYCYNKGYYVRRWDSGTLSDDTVSASDDVVDSGSWQQWSALVDESSIEFVSPSGNSITLSDQTYSDINLGVICYQGQYIDDIQFSPL